jgi:hypothetical protein
MGTSIFHNPMGLTACYRDSFTFLSVVIYFIDSTVATDSEIFISPPHTDYLLGSACLFFDPEDGGSTFFQRNVV